MAGIPPRPSPGVSPPSPRASGDAREALGLSLLVLGGCQNYGPFLGTLNIRDRIITGIQKETTILTTTQLDCHAAMEQIIR